MKYLSDTEIEQLKGKKVRLIRLSGDAFRAAVIGETFEEGTPGFQSENPHTIRLFYEYLRKREAWDSNFGSYDGMIDFVFSEDNEDSYYVFVDPDVRNGKDFRYYEPAERAIVNDILQQTFHRARLLGSQRVKEAVVISGQSSSFRDTPTHNPLEIKAMSEALLHLDRRAFTFGKAGEMIYVSFVLANGKRISFRLRPLLYRTEAEARRATNPPLPMPLWKRLYG